MSEPTEYTEVLYRQKDLPLSIDLFEPLGGQNYSRVADLVPELFQFSN